MKKPAQKKKHWIWRFVPNPNDTAEPKGVFIIKALIFWGAIGTAIVVTGYLLGYWGINTYGI